MQSQANSILQRGSAIWERRLSAVAARHSPPCAKGGQTAAGGQGGLTALSCLDDISRRVWLSSAGSPTSLRSVARCGSTVRRPRHWARPDTGPAAQVASGGTPPIPQSAFADSSLCTREVRWPDGHTVFALARCACLGKESMTAQASGLPGAGAPQPPLCKGGTAWQGHAGGIVKPGK